MTVVPCRRHQTMLAVLLETESFFSELLHSLIVDHFHVFACCLDHWGVLLELRYFLWSHSFYVNIS